jgi:transposase
MTKTPTCEDIIFNLQKARKLSYRELNKLGFSNRKIAYVNRYASIHNSSPTPLSRGRPPKINTAIMNTIENCTIQNRFLSSANLARNITAHFGVPISRATVNIIRKNLKFHYKPPKVRQHLNEKQKQKRENFAFTVLTSNEQITDIIFSDESRISLTPDNRMRW